MATLMTPGRLADLTDSEEFRALPFEDRSKVFENGVAEAHDHVTQSSGWTPELWKGFGAAVNARRAKIADSETTVEAVGSGLKTVGRVLKDSLQTMGVMGTGLSPVLPDGKPGGGVVAQVPGETLVPMLGQNIAKLDQSIAGKLAGKQELVTKPLDELKAKIDAGEFPMNDGKAFAGWLDEQNGKLSEAAKGYYQHRQGYAQEGVPEEVRKQRLDAVEPWTKQNDLSRPENASALARYLKTRSASAWDELRQNLLTTPDEAEIVKERNRLSTETPLGKALKPEVQSYIQEAADPMELGGMAFSVIKGAAAAVKGATKLRRVAEVAKGLAGEVLSEQGSLLMDSPNASPEQRWQVVKDSLIGALGLEGVGAVGHKIGERISGTSATEAIQSPDTQAALPGKSSPPETLPARQPLPPSESAGTPPIHTTALVPAAMPSAGATSVDNAAAAVETPVLDVVPVDPASLQSGGIGSLPASENGQPVIPAVKESLTAATAPEISASVNDPAEAPQGSLSLDAGTRSDLPTAADMAGSEAVGVEGSTPSTGASFADYENQQIEKANKEAALLALAVDSKTAVITTDGNGVTLQMGDRQSHPTRSGQLTATVADHQLTSEERLEAKRLAQEDSLAETPEERTDVRERTRALVKKVFGRVFGDTENIPGSTPATGAIDSENTPLQTAANAPSQSVESTAGVPAGAGGPGASSVEEWGASRFGQRITKAAPEMKGAWAQEFQPVQYRKRTEMEWEADSRRFVQAQGLGAADLVFDPDSGLEGSDRVALAGVLLDEADQAQAAGNPQAGVLANDLADWLSLNGSKAGQEVRAYGFLVKRDPRLIVESFRRKRNQDLEDGARKDLGVEIPSVEAEVKAVLLAERESAAVEVEQAVKPTAERAAREAGVVAATKQARDASTMQERADGLLDQYAKSQSDTLSWPGKKPPDALRALMREHITKGVPDFIERAQALGVDATTSERLMQVGAEETRRIENIKTAVQLAREAMADQAKAAGLVDQLAAEFSDTMGPVAKPVKSAFAELVAKAKKEPVVDLEAKLSALKMQPGTARQLAGLLDEYRRRESAVAEAKKRLADVERPENQAMAAVNRMAREFSDTPADAQTASNQVNALVSEALRAEEMPGDLAAQFGELGVTPATSAQLTRLVEMGRKRAAEVARERAGQKLIDSLTPKATRAAKAKLSPLIDKLLTAEQRGVLGRTEFLEAYAQAFDLPQITPEVQKRLTDLARSVRTMPEGLPKMEKAHELQNELAVFGGVKARDAAMAAWYANLLSGVSTQAVNVWGNAWHLGLRALASGVANPKDAMAALVGFIKGAPRGLLEARNAIKGGLVYKGLDKLGAVNALEEIAKIRFGDRTLGEKAVTVMSAGPVGRFALRGLAAMDGFFHGTAMEGRAHLAASRAVRARGLSVGSKAYWAAIADDLGHGQEQWKAAYEQGAQEARELGKNDLWAKRRAWDIVTRSRDLALRQEAQNWADVVTYQNDPAGSTGYAFKLLTSIQNYTLKGVPLLRPIVPFARVLSNVTSAALDMTPIGIWRGLSGKHLGGLGEQLQAWDARERVVLGTLGTAALTAIASLAFRGAADNDKDVGFMIYGAGPPDKNAKAQMPKGWKPYSIKWGDRYYSYAETPLGLGLSAVGAWLDTVRYKKNFDEALMGDKLGYVANAMGGALFSQGMLSSAGNLLDMLKGDRKMETLAANYLGGFIPGQGLLRDITSFFDDEKISATDVQSALLRDIPVIRHMAGRADLNIWGEPVRNEGKPIMKRFVTNARADDLSDWVTRNRLKVPSVPQSVEWTSYLTEGEKIYQRANRVEGGMLTPAERYKFVQESGSLMKARVSAFKREVESAKLRGEVVPKENMQRRIDTIARVARGEAMRKIVNR